MEEQGPPTLVTLPHEIQTKILSHLAVSFGKSTIQAALRTCKQLYEVALPLSVRVFRNTVPYPGDQGPCSPARNVQFLRYILVSKPWLAKHVKTVVIGSVSVDPQHDADYAEDKEKDSQKYTLNTIRGEELAIYQHYIELVLGQRPSSYSTSWCASWIEDLKKGTSDAQVALILLACPNIQTLLFEISLSRHFLQLLTLARTLSAGNGSPQTPTPGQGGTRYPEKFTPLSNLQDVFHEEAEFPESCEDLHMEASELFALPQLRSYESLGARGMESAATNFRSLPHRASTVEEITLHNAFCTADALCSMLGSCRALKKLEFSYNKPQSLERIDSVMPRDILDSILPHSDTLEYLYLNLQEDWDHRWEWHDCPERLYLGEDLRHMRSLKKLIVGMQALTGMLAAEPLGYYDMPLRVAGAPRIIDCLPDYLEYLVIHSCGPVVLDQVQELVMAVRQGSRLKGLKYIGVLHHAWRVDVQEIKTYMDNNSGFSIETEGVLHVDTGFQSMQVCYQDTSSTFYGCPDRPTNCTSRIYAPNLRQQWLERRMNPSYADHVGVYQVDPDLYCE